MGMNRILELAKAKVRATPKPPSKYTMVRIKRDVKAIAERKAAIQGRSTANYIEHLIRRSRPH